MPEASSQCLAGENVSVARSKFSRIVRRFALIMATGGVVLSAVAYFSVVHSTAYMKAEEFAKSSKVVATHLGQVLETRLDLNELSSVTYFGSKDRAHISILVVGNRKEGALKLELLKAGDSWQVVDGRLRSNGEEHKVSEREEPARQ
jgi:hypothetical protein